MKTGTTERLTIIGNPTAEVPGDLVHDGEIHVKGDLKVTGSIVAASISVTGNLDCWEQVHTTGGDVTAGGYIIAPGGIHSAGAVKAGALLSAADGDILAEGDIEGKAIESGGAVCGDNIRSGGRIFAAIINANRDIKAGYHIHGRKSILSGGKIRTLGGIYTEGLLAADVGIESDGWIFSRGKIRASKILSPFPPTGEWERPTGGEGAEHEPPAD